MRKKDTIPTIGVKLVLPTPVVRSAVARPPWFAVEEGPPCLEADQPHPLRLHFLPPLLAAEQVDRWMELVVSMGRRRSTELDLVVGSRMSLALRERFEAKGLSYLDSQGNVHLAWPGGVVHMAGGKRAVKVAARGLGASSVRAVQALLMSKGEIKVQALAATTHLSPAQAHATLVLLEEQGMLRSEGRGPNRRRILTDRSALLDWLGEQPAALRKDRSLEVALYARRPEELFRAVTSKLEGERVAHGLTGAAAASVYGTGPTAVPITVVRVSPDVSLEQAAEVLGAERTLRGANVRLVHDTGAVGSELTEVMDGVRLAPKVRVYLDLKSDRRGEDLAEQFREVQLGF